MLRGGLVATQMLGVAMTRYVWKPEPIASLPDEEIVACVAPTVQRYLGGDLARSLSVATGPWHDGPPVLPSATATTAL